jgi:hypothetical protein
MNNFQQPSLDQIAQSQGFNNHAHMVEHHQLANLWGIPHNAGMNRNYGGGGMQMGGGMMHIGGGMNHMGGMGHMGGHGFR